MKKIILGILIGVLLITCGYFYFTGDRTKTITSTSTLNETLKKSDLSTASYIYNGVANGTYEEKEYTIKYDATVSVGIDLEKVEVDTTSKKNTYIITLPEIKINSVDVDASSIETLKNTGIDSIKQYSLCKEDVTKKAKSNKSLKKLAKQNIKKTISALLVEDDYEIEWRES